MTATRRPRCFGLARARPRAWRALLGAALMVLVAGPAGAAQVTVRAWQHDNFARVVLDLSQKIGYQLSQDGNKVHLKFDQKISGRLDPAIQELPNYIRNIQLTSSQKDVTFILSKGLVAHDFRSGTAVVMDLMQRQNIAAYEDKTGETVEAPKPVSQAEKGGQSKDSQAAQAAGEPDNSAGGQALKVQVRGGEHSSYSRIVFEWPKPVGYSLGRQQGQVRLDFDRRGKPQTAKLNVDDLSNVGDVTFANGKDGLRAGITVGPNGTVRHFRLDNRVVVDALAGGGDPPPQAKLEGIATTRESAPVDSPDRVASSGGNDGGNDGGGGGAGEPSGRAGAQAKAGSGETGGTPTGDTTPEAAGKGSDSAQDGGSGKAPQGDQPIELTAFQGDPVKPPPGPIPKPGETASAELLSGGVPNPEDIGPIPLSDARIATVDAAAAARQGSIQVPEQPQSSKVRIPTPQETVPVVARIPIRAKKPAAAASFRRAGYIWLAFDRPVGLDPQAMIARGSDFLGQPDQIDTETGEVMRLPLEADVYPRLERTGRIWTLELRRAWVPPLVDLQVAPQPDFALGARLLVRTDSPRTTIAVRDPEVGDRLHIVPLPAPGHGIARRHAYPQAIVRRSPQGVVIQEQDDGLKVDLVDAGISVTAEGGLTMSPKNVVAGLQGEAQNPLTGTDRLFAMNRWVRGGAKSYLESRRQLQRQAALAPKGERNRDRLVLAQFWTAMGLGAKAEGVMDVMADVSPGVVDPVSFRALQGAAHVLQNDPDAALQRLQVAQLDKEPEAQLWRALARAQKKQWGEAKASLNASENVLLNYPKTLRKELIPSAIEIAWRAGDTQMAQKYLDKLPKRERVLLANAVDGESYDFDPSNPSFGDPVRSYWKGRLLADRGKKKEAVKALVTATRSRDRLHRFMAGRLRTELRRDLGQISAEAAVRKLERLRYEWRGDWREFNLLQALGDSYWQAEDYRSSFDTLRKAVSLYPDHPEADEVTSAMTERFYKLFRDGAQELPTEAALKLFKDYRELTPPGERGNELIRALADRLIGYGLLGRGANLLADQVRNELEGRQRLEVGTRLAAVRLLNGEPGKTLEALEVSRRLPIPPELARQRRILRARALAAQDKVDRALRTLRGGDSKAERLLYTDIAWQNQRWDDAAAGLKRIMAQRRPIEKLNAETSQLILNLGIAYLLADNAEGVARVRERYGKLMAEGPDANAFKIVTRGQGVGQTDLSTLNDQIAEVDDFRAFLTSYRRDRLERIAETGDGQAGS